MIYYLINTATDTIVGEYLSYNEAARNMMDEVHSRDGYYTVDDFTILDENELEDYYM